jgi:putative nucleotidyltransferase with HDIG domain
VAIQIKKLIAQEIDIKQIERIVESDPSLTAKLLKAANSPLFRTNVPITSIQHIIQLLGLRTIKNLVFTYAIRDLFHSNNAALQKRLSEVWMHSAEVASVSYALAQRLGTFDPDHAMLLGLLHDIGMLPIISYLEHFPDLMESPNLIDETITRLHGEIGAAIMEKWRFGEDYVSVATGADDWYRNPRADADYCDLIMIAQLHAFIGKQTEDIQKLVGEGKIPNLAELPAFRKLCLSWDDPEKSISVLVNAHQQLNEIKNLLIL